MSRLGAPLIAGAVLALAMIPAPGAAGPLRIGASISQTGPLAAPGQNQLRGYRLCVKHANDGGGLLGRRVELLVEDDRSTGPTAAAIYERLITEEKVDAILGPYSSPLTEAMADVTERHRMPMVSAGGAAMSIFTKGRRFVFGIHAPAETWLRGLVQVAADRGLKTVGVIHEDSLLQRSIALGAVELARKRGLQVVLRESYLRGTTDFRGVLGKVKTANPDVLAAASYEAVAITRLLKQLDINPRMFGGTVEVAFPGFLEALGRDAEFVYGASSWEPELVTLRAGGLIPLAREYPRAREFVDAYRKAFPGAELSYHAAQGYGGCQVLVEAIRRAGSLESEPLRDAILKLDFHTVFGAFKVDPRGMQVAHRNLVFQWQDGRKVIVWPEELAPGTPRFPTPPWRARP